MADFIPADFDKAYEELLIVEGGYVHDASDSGGETYRGISRRNWPSWPGWEIVDELKEKYGTNPTVFNPVLAANPMLQALIKKFYYDEFWVAVRAPELDHRVACELFDTAVNMGKLTAVQLLQDVLNLFNKGGTLWPDLPVTGNFLAMTKSAVQAFVDSKGWMYLAMVLNLRQAARYFEIVRGNASQEKFMHGWITSRVLKQMGAA